MFDSRFGSISLGLVGMKGYLLVLISAVVIEIRYHPIGQRRVYCLVTPFTRDCYNNVI